VTTAHPDPVPAGGTAPAATGRAAALAAGLVLAAAIAAVALGRERAPEDSRLASPDNPGAHGAAALWEWLEATGRRPLRGPPHIARDVPVVPAPPAPLDADEVDALLAHARAGGLVIWAAGPPGSQPELAQRLRVARARGEREPEAAVPLAPHHLVDGLSLSVSGASVESEAPGALPVAGGPGFTSVLSIPVGRGEVLVLAGADLLENRRLERGDNLLFWARVSDRGRPAFDEQHWIALPPPRAASSLGLLLFGAQAVLAALALGWARGRRMGAVRPPPPAAASRTAADYLASLGSLYRRARAERELGAAAWGAHRLRLQRRAGIAARLPDGAAAERLAALSPEAAGLFREAARIARQGAASPVELLALVRSTARAEELMLRRAGARRPGAGQGPA
jgi:hypothetical protein